MVARRHRYSLADYLAIEEMSAVRHEFLDGEIFAMAGGTPEHAALAAATLVILGSQLAGQPGRVYSSDLRVRVLATGLATYPDAAIVCGEARRDPASPTHVTNPSVVIEVLSKSTAEYDRGEKREHYQQIPTLGAYVLIEQDERAIEVYARGDDDTWRHTRYGSGETVALPRWGLRIAVDDLYAAAGIA